MKSKSRKGQGGRARRTTSSASKKKKTSGFDFGKFSKLSVSSLVGGAISSFNQAFGNDVCAPSCSGCASMPVDFSIPVSGCPPSYP